MVDGTRSRWLAEAGGAPPVRAQTTADLLDEAVGRHPEREAIVYADDGRDGPRVRWTYEELRARARDVGHAFVASGHAPGDRIAIWATNLPEWLLLLLGAAYAGVAVVPVNPLLRRDEVHHILRTSGARTVFVLPHNRGASLWDIAFESSAAGTDVSSVIALGEPAPDDRGTDLETWLRAAGGLDEERLLARTASVAAEDIAQIQFTSGTTGLPKGAALTHLGLVNNARQFFHRAGISATRYCSPLPFFHTGGSAMSTLGSLSTGSTFIPLPTFEGGAVVRAIDREGATAIQTVPTMLLELERHVDQGAGTLESVETVVIGGANVPQAVCERWQERFGVRFTIVYGLTETSPVITQTSPFDRRDLQVSNCGIALPHVTWDVADPQTGDPVALGEQGEVRTRGWLVMRGYHGDEAATAEMLTDDGWLRTGDLGRMDADGRLWLTGRAKDMVIRGGENIYPSEVEAVIRELPGVRDAAVVGVPDEHYGEVCVAFVIPDGSVELDGDGVRASLGGRLARYKVPQAVTVVDAFPLTGSGKVQKFHLRDAAMRARAASGAG